MNEGIYGGTAYQVEGVTTPSPVTTTAGAFTLPAGSNSSTSYDVFASVSGADVFETDTSTGAGGAKIADGSNYVSIGRYRAGSVIEFRTAAGTSIVSYTAKKIVG